MTFISWIKRTFQDKAGEPSSRRITAFVLTFLFVVLNIWYAIEINDKEYRLYQLIIVAAMILLLFGVITWGNIKEMIPGIPGLKSVPKISNDGSNDNG